MSALTGKQISAIAKKAGLDVSLWDMGSGSLVTSDGLPFVTRADFEACMHAAYDKGFSGMTEFVEVAKQELKPNEVEHARLHFKYGDLTLGQLYLLCAKAEAGEIGKGSPT